MLSTIYINKSGDASSEIEKVVEPCPLFDSCGKFKIQDDERICKGIEGDYNKCSVLLAYNRNNKVVEGIGGGYLD